MGGRDTENKNKRGDITLLFPQRLNSYSYSLNNPLVYVDPSGEIAETAWDIGNMIYDGGRIVKNGIEIGVGIGFSGYGYITNQQAYVVVGEKGIQRNIGELNQAVVDLVFDGIATGTPFVPAGWSKVLRRFTKKVTTKWNKSRKYYKIQGTDFFKNNKNLVKTKFQNKGQAVFKDSKTGKYYSLDKAHKNHLEIFDRHGKHLGRGDPETGRIIEGKRENYKIYIK